MSDNIVVINEKEFEIGVLSPRQVAAIANLLGDVMLKGNSKLSSLQDSTDSNAIIWAVLSVLDEQSILKLAVAVTGCDEKFAKDNFSLTWVIKALQIQLKSEDLRAVIENFTTGFSQTSPEPSQ